jgi:hypothetical protein
MVAPRVGLEPTTTRLTAECSTIELSRNKYFKIRSWQRPTLPGTHVPSTIGAGELNCCVRNGNRCGLSAIITRKPFIQLQLLSQNYTVKSSMLSIFLRSSPRPISTGQLQALLPFHTRPINQIFSLESYQLLLWEILS